MFPGISPGDFGPLWSTFRLQGKLILEANSWTELECLDQDRKKKSVTPASSAVKSLHETRTRKITTDGTDGTDDTDGEAEIREIREIRGQERPGPMNLADDNSPGRDQLSAMSAADIIRELPKLADGHRQAVREALPTRPSCLRTWFMSQSSRLHVFVVHCPRAIEIRDIRVIRGQITP